MNGEDPWPPEMAPRLKSARLGQARSTGIGLLVSLLATPACGSDAPNPYGARAENQTLSREDRKVLDAAKAKQAELQDLRAHPDRYIEMGLWTSYDKGIINDYTRVTKVELHNKSSFDIREISGEFEYLSKSGKVMATVPITFVGELRAGETRELKARARTISGKAHNGRLTVKSVTARE